MHRPLPLGPTDIAVPQLVRSHSDGAHRPSARPLPLPAPHLASSSLFLAPSSAPHPARPGKRGPFAQELFVLSLHVSEFLPPSSSCQWTTKTGSIYPVFSESAAFLHACPPWVCPRSPDFGDDEPLFLLEFFMFEKSFDPAIRIQMRTTHLT